eukprot:CAMPEP_0184400946 /NCGR_PEP_ID=MMETSP0007-20130409/77020_1 /TAXON_ID=97485 /ORGANISM="Prymnesium parvum, Strain Texoma1" /LENGTH=62 /DNA_ID=CAMNT_0026756131 /DNA_START=36 /DNA_END=221 /DNA_ORIENTATION=+
MKQPRVDQISVTRLECPKMIRLLTKERHALAASIITIIKFLVRLCGMRPRNDCCRAHGCVNI